MNILSLHSQVIAGHVGNNAVVLPLQMLGFEVWAIPTVVYSNHPGHGTFTGRMTPADEITALVDGLDDRGLLSHCDGVLVGYLGDPAQARAAADTIERVRQQSPAATVCCDPILGDRDIGLYVREEVPEAISNYLIPLANLATPNHFELEFLTRTTVKTLDDALAAAQQLRMSGPDLVVCTSLERAQAQANQMETLLVGPLGNWLGRHDRVVAQAPHGTGDLFAALLLGQRLQGKTPEMALKAALSSVWSVVQASEGARDQELALVAARAQIAAPELSAKVEKLE
jgi:pyridoxine kinase